MISSILSQFSYDQGQQVVPPVVRFVCGNTTSLHLVAACCLFFIHLDPLGESCGLICVSGEVDYNLVPNALNLSSPGKPPYLKSKPAWVSGMPVPIHAGRLIG